MKADRLEDFRIPGMEEKMLDFHNKSRVFEKSLEAARDHRSYVFCEGPPAASGRAGICSIISLPLKDLGCRRKSAKEFHSEAGFIKYEMVEFNEKFRESVFK